MQRSALYDGHRLEAPGLLCLRLFDGAKLPVQHCVIDAGIDSTKALLFLYFSFNL